MRQPLRALVALLLLTCVITLAGEARASDDKWIKVTTKHFELITDLDESTALEAAKELETTRDALITAAWPKFDFPEVVRTGVYVLSNGLDFERLFGRHTWGLFISGTRPAFYLYGPPSRWAPRWSLRQAAPSSVLRHEMTHQLASAVFRRTPRWFDEGLAQFLETVQISEDAQSVIVGKWNVSGLAKFRSDRTMTLKRTLEWDQSIADLPESEVHGLYGTSWAFFHWLYNNRQEQFANYQMALAQGIDPKRAWDTAFPDFHPDELDPILYEYLRHGEGAVDTLPLRTTVPSLDLKRMSVADSLAARAHLALTGSNVSKETRLNDARTLVKKALELDATNVDALLLDEWTPVDDRVDAVRRATTVHPDDSRLFGLLGDLLANSKEREAAYRRALELNHEDPQLLNNLAGLLVKQRRADEAFPYAVRAVRRAPHDYSIIDTYAEVLFRRGRCPEALVQQKRAADRAREAGRHATEQMGKRLATMREACATSGEALPAGSNLGDAGDVAPGTEDAPAPPAPTRKEPRRHHEGLSANLMVGLGYGSGSYESTQGTTQSGSFGGAAVDIAAALGYGLRPGFVLALEVGFFAHPEFDQPLKFADGAFVSNLALVRAGILADIHPAQRLPFHMQIGLDYIHGVWSGWPGSSLVSALLPLDEGCDGFFASLSAGYTWRVFQYDLGPALRVHYGSLGSEHSSGSFAGASIMLGVFL